MKTGRIEQAIAMLNARQLAGSTESKSHIGGIDPRAMLVVTLSYLVAMLSVPVANVGMVIWFAAFPIIESSLAHVDYGRLFKSSLYVLPLLLLIGVFNPVFDRRTAFMVGDVAVSCGWTSFAGVLIRGLLSVQALLLLIYVAGFNRMCQAMLQLRVPRVLVVQLLMVYRYLTVLLQEALSMHRARLARAYGRNSYGARMWGAFVGQLLLRTVERGRRVNLAMKARGFNGSLLSSRPGRWTTADTVYCAVWIPVIAAMRFADLSHLLLEIIKV